MRYNDLMICADSDNKRKDIIRQRIMKTLINCLNQEFNDEYVRCITKDIYLGESASKIPKNTIVIDVGDVLDKDKMTMGALVEISIKVKNWNGTKTAKTNREAFSLIDIDEALKE